VKRKLAHSRDTSKLVLTANSRDVTFDSGSGGFADTQAHPHDSEDAVAFLQITGRIEVARPGKINIKMEDVAPFVMQNSVTGRQNRNRFDLTFQRRLVTGEVEKFENIAPQS
jgi:hypothetical protein